MGNSPLTVCIQQACNLEKQMVQVVLPDGQVLYLPHPLTASMLMEAHPCHFVCQGSPSLLEQRLPLDTKLESGEIYYLLPFPGPEVANAMLPWRGGQQQQLKVKSPAEKLAYVKPPLLFDEKSSTAFSRLSLRPQQCLINLFLFRQRVASIMPEESLKSVSASQAENGGSNYHQNPDAVMANKYNSRLESKHRGVRGRKQAVAWKPQLESISETKPWHDFTTKNYINNFSVSMISSIKALATTSPLSLPPNSNFFPPGGEEQYCSASIQAAPFHDGRDAHRHRFIYSA